jgi:hypothetical protein
MSASRSRGAENRLPAAEMARELPEFFVAPAIIAWTGGNLFNQSPASPDQLACSYRADQKQQFRSFSSHKGFPKAGKTLKKFSEIASAYSERRVAPVACLHCEEM